MTVFVTLAILVLFAMAAVFSGAPVRPAPAGEHGNAIAYQEGSAIYAAWPDGSHRVELSAGVPFARLPVFSPDGLRIAFVAPSSADEAGGTLTAVPFDGASAAIDLSHGIEVIASDVPQVSWSPDGTMLVFTGLADGVATLFVTASDGSQAPVRITDGTADRDLPTWSPDGEWIAFRERDSDGIHTRLRTVRPDGTEVREITQVIATDAYLSKARWFLEATPMTYWFNPGFGSDDSAHIDLGFGHVNVPWSGTAGGLADFGIPWSPDGEQQVVLTRDEGVLVVDHDDSEPYGGQVRRLGPVAECWVDWAPDGRSLYGGSPGGCDGVVVIPLSDPGSATLVPGSTAGVASWQPPANDEPSP